MFFLCADLSCADANPWVRDNCAISPFLLLNKYFGKTESETLKNVDRFFTDANLADNKSFEDFVRFFGISNANYLVFHDPSLSALQTTSNDEVFYLVRSSPIDRDEHYVAIWKQKDGNAILADGSSIQKVNFKEAITLVRSGNPDYLLAWFLNSDAQKKYSSQIELNSKAFKTVESKIANIEKNDHSPEKKTYQLIAEKGALFAKVDLSLLGATKEDIVDVVGSCSCFTGYDLEDNNVIFNFDLGKLQDVRKSVVMIQFHDKKMLFSPNGEPVYFDNNP